MLGGQPLTGSTTGTKIDASPGIGIGLIGWEGEVPGPEEAIERLVRSIVEIVNPLRVIVFGSAARDTWSPGNDVDLLVVMPAGTHRRKTEQELYRRIHSVGVPFDLLVATSEDLERHKDNVGLIYRNILAEGREVYAA